MTNRQLLTLIVSVVACAVALGILMLSTFTILQSSFQSSLESSVASLQSSHDASYESLRSSQASLQLSHDASYESLRVVAGVLAVDA